MLIEPFKLEAVSSFAVVSLAVVPLVVPASVLVSGAFVSALLLPQPAKVPIVRTAIPANARVLIIFFFIFTFSSFLFKIAFAYIMEYISRKTFLISYFSIENVNVV